MEVDASQKAIGMALLQSVSYHDQREAHYVENVDAKIDNLENKHIPSDLLPVAYGSKTLTDAESGYVNIERELLGSSSQGGEISYILLWEIYPYTI